jgi:protein TonB
MKHLFLLPLLMMVFPLCHASINTQGYKCYQTFDECKMCGVGTPVDTPFVYVRETPDSIFVKLSTNTAEDWVYVKKGNVWRMDMMLDLRKMTPHYHFHQDEYWPRRYTRFCGGVRIIEVLREYDPYEGDISKRVIYVKNDTSCIQINVPPSITLRKYSDILKLVNSYTTLDDIVYDMIKKGDFDKYHDYGFITLRKKIENDTLQYFVDDIKFEISYKYKLNSLKEFGIQPGLYEKSIDLWYFAFRVKEFDDDIYRSLDVHPVYPDEVVFKSVEIMPSYPDGELALLQDLADKVSYPEEAKKGGIQGRVVLKCEIKKDGSIGKVIIGRSLSPECDQAAIDAVKRIKKFNPGLKNGVAVNVWYIIPVTFKLQS